MRNQKQKEQWRLCGGVGRGEVRWVGGRSNQRCGSKRRQTQIYLVDSQVSLTSISCPAIAMGVFR